MEFDLQNKDFIERLFHQPVKSYEISEGCKKGDNVAGSLKSIVATTESGETISAVIKTFPPKDSPYYDQLSKGGIFRVESQVYTVVAKDIEDLVNTLRDPADTDAFSLPLPKIYDYFNDDENDYICLEDVRPQGYIMPNVFKGLSYSETSLILEELARFHAYSYALIRHHGEQLFGSKGKLARLDYRDKADQMDEWYSTITGCVGNSIEILQDINPSLAKMMQEEVPVEKASRFMDSIFKLTDEKLFPCIVHGDLWSNNVLIKYDDEKEKQEGKERKPIAVKFVDFQFTRRGSIFDDLVYFIYTSTNTEFRKKFLTRVLQDYYNSFRNAMELIKVPMPINFTLGFLLDTFNSLAKGALVYMCFAIPFQFGKPSEDPEAKNETKKDEVKTVPEATDPGAMFLSNLRQMTENSPPALKRLEEIAIEVLGFKNN